MIRIAIADQQMALKLQRRDLQSVVRAVLKGEGLQNVEISVALVDDAMIAKLNWQFLHHRGPTDVITFPLNDPGETTLAGEIVISTETAASVAKKLSHAAHHEVTLYLIHGLLHLCGYDDHALKDRRHMQERQDHYFRQLAIPLSSAPANRKSKI